MHRRRPDPRGDHVRRRRASWPSPPSTSRTSTPPTRTSKFDGLAGAIVGNLKSPDILALEEVQDNNGPTNDAMVAAGADATQQLITAIQAAGGPTYQFRQIDPVDDQDGGEPGGNIRVGFLFRTDRGLSFVDRPGGGSTTPNTVVVRRGAVPQLLFSPGRIDPTNPAFTSSRKPLAGEFVVQRPPRCSWSPTTSTPRAATSRCSGASSRRSAASRGAAPAAGPESSTTSSSIILAVDARRNVVVLGDLNDFEFSTPLSDLKDGGLTTLIETLPPNERYTYVFEGNSQALDHILVSDNLFEHAASATTWSTSTPSSPTRPATTIRR